MSVTDLHEKQNGYKPYYDLSFVLFCYFYTCYFSGCFFVIDNFTNFKMADLTPPLYVRLLSH